MNFTFDFIEMNAVFALFCGAASVVFSVLTLIIILKNR